MKMVALSEVATIERISVQPSEIIDGTTYVGLENIASGGTFVGVGEVANGELASSKFKFGIGHILYGKLRPYLTKIALPEMSGICSTDILPIKVSDQSDRRYLAYFLRQKHIVNHVNSLATGANLPRISPKVLGAVEVPCPPMNEQRRIAAILDKADDLRTKRREAITQLDSLAQSIFHEMFGDPVLNVSGYAERALVELCRKTDDIKCGPFGTQLSRSEYKNSGIPLWGIRQVNTGFATLPPEFLDEQTAERLSAYSVVPGDIVMTRKGDVGKCAVYPNTRSAGIMHSDVLRVRLGSSVETEFISHQLHHSSAIRRQVDLISQGAIMKGINVTKLKSLRVLTPPLEMQQEFTRRVSSIEHLKLKYRAQFTELDNLFLSLQDRAFKGEL